MHLVESLLIVTSYPEFSALLQKAVENPHVTYEEDKSGFYHYVTAIVLPILCTLAALHRKDILGSLLGALTFVYCFIKYPIPKKTLSHQEIVIQHLDNSLALLDVLNPFMKTVVKEYLINIAKVHEYTSGIDLELCQKTVPKLFIQSLYFFKLFPEATRQDREYRHSLAAVFYSCQSLLSHLENYTKLKAPKDIKTKIQMFVEKIQPFQLDYFRYEGAERVEGIYIDKETTLSLRIKFSLLDPSKLSDADRDYLFWG